MSYSIVRRTDRNEATSPVPVPVDEASAAVRLLRDWSAVYPQQRLAINDGMGQEIAFRRPWGGAPLR
jgi:hypothetical protein